MPVTIRQLAHSDPAFRDCFKIRLEVFVGEQKVPETEERDELDPLALHFLAFDGAAARGTARVLVKPDGNAKISRVAVRKSARGHGLGAALINAIEQELPLVTAYILDAQLAALPFYERLGYTPQGDIFMEANIPHRHMQKRPA